MMDVILRNPLFLVIFGISLALLIVRIFKGSSDTNDALNSDMEDEIWYESDEYSQPGAFTDERAMGIIGIEPYATMYGYDD